MSSAATRWARRSGSSRCCASAGYDAPIYLHGAMIRLCELYEERGIPLGDLRPVDGMPKARDGGADRHRAALGASRTAGAGGFPIRCWPWPRAG